MSLADLDSNIHCPSCGSSDVYWWRTYKRRHRYVCRACDHRFFADGCPLDIVDTPEIEYEKDVWDIRNLGAIGQETAEFLSAYKLNFTKIHQSWLKIAAKKFSKYGLAILAFRTVCYRLRDLNYLSVFLQTRYPLIQPSEINREVMLDFINFLYEKGLSGRTRQAAIYNVRVFFEQCVRNDWLDLPKTPLLFQEDLPPRETHNPRYIPEEVLEQLNQHIEELPESIMRMFLVIQECGMRISELCLLRYDCISQDAAGDWWLTYRQFKMRKDHTIIISKELAGVIQEQQKYIRGELGQEFIYLFCGSKGGWLKQEDRRQGPLRLIDGRFIPVPSRPSPNMLANILNQLAKKHNICTAAGELWHFQAHQFRHSVGTSMVNRGVPIHIISRFLGHETLGMTQVYAHLHDPTLKKEIAKYHGKIVDIAGRVIEIDPNSEVDSSDYQWFKRNIQAQSLSNGSCALPVHQKECPHANACLTCFHFRTTLEFLDQHKAQLKQTEQLLEKARANEWHRQIEMNERVAQNLQNIISKLEEGNASA